MLPKSKNKPLITGHQKQNHHAGMLDLRCLVSPVHPEIVLCESENAKKGKEKCDQLFNLDILRMPEARPIRSMPQLTDNQIRVSADRQ